MLTLLLVSLFFGFASFFLWIILHELSHFMAAKLVRWNELSDVKFNFLPHKNKETGDFAWASVSMRINPPLTPSEDVFFLLSPNILYLVSVIMLPMIGFIGAGIPQAIWLCLWGGGLVRFANALTVTSESSDLQRASKVLNWNPWALRIAGWTIVVASALVTIIILF